MATEELLGQMPKSSMPEAAYRQKRVLEWTRERERLTETLEANDGGGGWPLSPEARTNLRKDIAEVNRTLARLQADEGDLTP